MAHAKGGRPARTGPAAFSRASLAKWRALYLSPPATITPAGDQQRAITLDQLRDLVDATPFFAQLHARRGIRSARDRLGNWDLKDVSVAAMLAFTKRLAELDVACGGGGGATPTPAALFELAAAAFPTAARELAAHDANGLPFYSERAPPAALGAYYPGLKEPTEGQHSSPNARIPERVLLLLDETLWRVEEAGTGETESVWRDLVAEIREGRFRPRLAAAHAPRPRAPGTLPPGWIRIADLVAQELAGSARSTFHKGNGRTTFRDISNALDVRLPDVDALKAQLAELLAPDADAEVHALLLRGPSKSGKTTASIRLQYELREDGALHVPSTGIPKGAALPEGPLLLFLDDQFDPDGLAMLCADLRRVVTGPAAIVLAVSEGEVAQLREQIDDVALVHEYPWTGALATEQLDAMLAAFSAALGIPEPELRARVASRTIGAVVAALAARSAPTQAGPGAEVGRALDTLAAVESLRWRASVRSFEALLGGRLTADAFFAAAGPGLVRRDTYGEMDYPIYDRDGYAAARLDGRDPAEILMPLVAHARDDAQLLVEGLAYRLPATTNGLAFAREAVRRFPVSRQLLRTCVYKLLALHEADEAQRLLVAASAIPDQRAWAMRRLARLRSKDAPLGDPVAPAPDSRRGMLRAAVDDERFDGGAHVDLAKLEEMQNNLGPAITIDPCAEGEIPEPWTARGVLARAYRRSGGRDPHLIREWLRVEIGLENFGWPDDPRPGTARWLSDRALDIAPRDPAILRQRGRIEAEDGNLGAPVPVSVAAHRWTPGSARWFFAEARRHEPNTAKASEAVTNAMWAYAEYCALDAAEGDRGDEARARKRARIAMKLDPTLDLPYRTLAGLAAREGRPGERDAPGADTARAYYRDGVASVDDPQARARLLSDWAEFEADQGEAEEVERLTAELATGTPYWMSRAHAIHGHFLQARAREPGADRPTLLRRALREYDAALKIRPNDVARLARRAECVIELGEPEDVVLGALVAIATRPGAVYQAPGPVLRYLRGPDADTFARSQRVIDALRNLPRATERIARQLARQAAWIAHRLNLHHERDARELWARFARDVDPACGHAYRILAYDAARRDGHLGARDHADSARALYAQGEAFAHPETLRPLLHSWQRDECAYPDGAFDEAARLAARLLDLRDHPYLVADNLVHGLEDHEDWPGSATGLAHAVDDLIPRLSVDAEGMRHAFEIVRSCVTPDLARDPAGATAYRAAAEKFAAGEGQLYADLLGAFVRAAATGEPGSTNEPGTPRAVFANLLDEADPTTVRLVEREWSAFERLHGGPAAEHAHLLRWAAAHEPGSARAAALAYAGDHAWSETWRCRPADNRRWRDRAIAAYEAALEHDPRNGRAAAGRVGCLVARRWFPDALEAALTALDRPSREPKLLMTLEDAVARWIEVGDVAAIPWTDLAARLASIHARHPHAIAPRNLATLAHFAEAAGDLQAAQTLRSVTLGTFRERPEPDDDTEDETADTEVLETLRRAALDHARGRAWPTALRHTEAYAGHGATHDAHIQLLQDLRDIAHADGARDAVADIDRRLAALAEPAPTNPANPAAGLPGPPL